MNLNAEAHMNCPACGRKYTIGSARIILQKKAYVLMHISCVSCFVSSIVFTARKNGQTNVISLGSLTDLSFEEASLVLRKKPLSINEVIEICSQINAQEK